jgi:dienelactone hydrolase
VSKRFVCCAWFVACLSGCVSEQPTALPLSAAGAGITGQASDLRCAVDPTLSGQQRDYAQPGPFQVGSLDLTLEDRARPVVASAQHPAAPARVLPTTIFYPAAGRAPLLGAAALADGGPFPLLVYSHGFGSSRSEATAIGQRAASHGYIVVAPEFPFTNTMQLLADAQDTSDIANQAGDVSFLIDQLLGFARDPRHPLANAVDETRIGATGVSMGGLTTLLAALHPTLHDERIRAAAPIAPLSSFFTSEYYHTRDIPLLFVHGDLDAFTTYPLHGRRAFERAAPNARLVTLVKGTHAAFAFQLDRDTLALMNGLLAAPGADPHNADAFGCGVIGASLQNDHGYIPPLGGIENFIDYDPQAEPIRPCAGDEITKPGMDANEQVELAARAVVAFFDAHLGMTPEVRQGGCHYLLNELPKTPVLTVE